jgi:hypothetical protein
MTHEDFKKLKVGDKVYVPFIEKTVESSIGTHYIGSDMFEKYTYRRLPVEDVVIHNYDPDGNGFGWKQGLIVQLVKFNLDTLTEEEKKMFIKTYRDYFPVLCKSWKFEDTEKYGEELYFEVPYNQGIKESYAESAISLLWKNKKMVNQAIKLLNKHNLKRIDNIIKYYQKTLKPEIKKFLKDDDYKLPYE